MAGGNTQTGAGCETKALSIVPVKVKGRGKGTIIETYALLDNGSMATFCTEQLLEDLGVHGKKCELSQATTENENTKSECMVASLEVMDLEDNVMVEMPTVFSRKKLNIPLGGISKQTVVDQWPYLHGIKLPKKIESNICLLIGLDVPEALEPDEIRKSMEKGGPYAVKTKFGWTLNGPMGRFGQSSKQCHYIITGQSEDPISKQLDQFFNFEFNESLADLKTGMS